MLASALITKLQEAIEANHPFEEMTGPLDIQIDMFRWNENIKAFDYIGFSPDIRITKSADGVYDILTAFELEPSSSL